MDTEVVSVVQIPECLFVCNRGDTVQYHGVFRLRELGQAPKDSRVKHKNPQNLKTDMRERKRDRCFGSAKKIPPLLVAAAPHSSLQ